MDNISVPTEPIRLDTELRRELTAGEEILWTGIPDPKRMLFVLTMWIFAVPWTSFALAWTGIAFSAYLSGIGLENGDVAYWGWIFPLWGTPLIAVGLWMMKKPLDLLDDAKHTIHALTNQRLITLTIRKGREVKTASIAKLGPIRYKEKRQGWGDLFAETGSHIDSDGDRITDRFEIVAVPEVEKLHRLLIETKQSELT